MLAKSGCQERKTRDILSFAVIRNASVVILDSDFHTILAVSGTEAPSVIRVRMQGLDAAAVLGVVKRVITEYSRELEAGCLIMVKPN